MKNNLFQWMKQHQSTWFVLTTFPGCSPAGPWTSSARIPCSARDPDNSLASCGPIAALSSSVATFIEKKEGILDSFRFLTESLRHFWHLHTSVFFSDRPELFLYERRIKEIHELIAWRLQLIERRFVFLRRLQYNVIWIYFLNLNVLFILIMHKI